VAPATVGVAAREPRIWVMMAWASGIEVVSVLVNALVTLAGAHSIGLLRWFLPIAGAVLFGVAQVLIENARGGRPATAPTHGRRGRGRAARWLIALVVLLLVGALGVAVTAGVRFATGWITGKELGDPVLIAPVSARAGGLGVTVNGVELTRHFTRVQVEVENQSEDTLSVPVFHNISLTADSKETLEADLDRSRWAANVPPGVAQRGTLIFSGHLPEGTTRASLSFATVYGSLQSRPVTVKRIKLRA
jgi:hypothetical protein